MAAFDKAVVVQDSSGVVTGWDAGADALFGFSRGEAVGRVLEDLLRQTESDGVHVTIKDGSRHAVRLTRTSARDAEGLEVAVVSVYELADPSVTEPVLASVAGAQSALAREDDRLARIVQLSPALIYSFQRWPDGRSCLPFARDEIADLFGVRPEEVREDATPGFARIHRDDLAGVLDSIEASQRDLSPWQTLFRVQHPEKGELWVEGHSRPTREADGSTLWSGVFTDVTARKNATDRLSFSERHFERAFRASPTGTIMVRLDEGSIVDVNDAFLRLFGGGRDDFVGRRVEDVALLDDVAIHHRGPVSRADLVARLRLERTVRNVGLDFRRSDGVRRGALLSADTTEIAGAAFGLIVVEDFTSHTHGREVLRESDAHLRQLTDNIREVFWLNDPIAGQVLYVSPAYETVWGRPCPGPVEGWTGWLDAVHEADRARVTEAARTKQANGTFDEEYRIVRPDGSERWVRDRAFPVRDDAGNVVRVAGVAEDITERRELERQLRETQKMETVGQLAGAVAHDFNNLMTSIGLCAEEIIARADAPGEILGPAREICDAVGRAASLTGDLMAFSRREIRAPEIVSLAEIVTDSERMLRRLLGENVILAVEVDPVAGFVRVDRGHWASLLVNLAVNARDAMPGGGRLTISARRQTSAGADVGMIEVTDTGVGIGLEVRARVFEPFFTTKGPGKGTGLGLAVVRGIVQQSGGTIDVDSTPGVGTTFTIRVPLQAGPGTTSRPSTEPVGGDGEGRTLLVVEDERLIREVLERSLSACGFRVLAAPDAEEALRILDDRAVDLLITDVVLPAMDGLTLAQVARTKQADVRVLFMSGYAEDDALKHGIARADVAFLAKPYKLSALVEKVRLVLSMPGPTSKAITSVG